MNIKNHNIEFKVKDIKLLKEYLISQDYAISNSINEESITYGVLFPITSDSTLYAYCHRNLNFWDFSFFRTKLKTNPLKLQHLLRKTKLKKIIDGKI